MDVIRTRIDTYPEHICKQLTNLHEDIDEIVIIKKMGVIRRIEFMMKGMDGSMCVDDFKDNHPHVYEHMKQIEQIVLSYESEG